NQLNVKSHRINLSIFLLLKVLVIALSSNALDILEKQTFSKYHTVSKSLILCLIYLLIIQEEGRLIIDISWFEILYKSTVVMEVTIQLILILLKSIKCEVTQNKPQHFSTFKSSSYSTKQQRS
ncbi:MAG: hypothetical protein SWX82_32855, partial [Cyanobacteriota bacterium]|nr:hypothetical protein [Cyanobacteriota bacterium]